MTLLLHASIKTIIDKWIKEKTIINALLFHGSLSGFPSHGAEYYISKLLHLRGETLKNNPCFMHLPRKDVLKIEDIRNIQEYVQFGADDNKELFVFIENIELLTLEAANAFLKTLESPPINVYFILSSFNYVDIIPTIRSRCQQIYCPPISINTLLSYEKVSDDCCNHLSYHQLVYKIYDPDFSHSVTFSNFYSLSFYSKLSFFLPILKNKDHIKKILYHWLFDIQSKNTSQFSPILPCILECISALNFSVNIKLQIDALVCKIDSLVV